MGCHFLLQCMRVKSESEVTQWCLTLSDVMDCSLPGSSVHGIFQARVLEWVAIVFSAYIVCVCVCVCVCVNVYMCIYIYNFSTTLGKSLRKNSKEKKKGRLEKMTKGRQIRDHIANIHWIKEKTREFQEKHLLH